MDTDSSDEEKGWADRRGVLQAAKGDALGLQISAH